MKKLLLLIAFLCVGCSTTARLYPVEGPMSKQIPLPVLAANVEGILGNTGGITLTMPDGERCTGHWSSIAPQQVGFTSVAASGLTTSGLASAWTTAYGSGFSFSNAPGVNRGEAMLTGEKGTVLQVEFFTGSGTANGTGVAKDNHGNVFKVLF
jgi:hypothetical protein